jgi:hypothetical protein
LGTHLAKTLWNPRMSFSTEYAVPWLMPSCNAVSSVVLSVRILALVFASHQWFMLMTVSNAWHQLHLFNYFFNIYIHSYTLYHDNVLCSYLVC